MAEVQSEPQARQATEQPDEPAHARTRAYLVEADGRASERRVHQIATKYAPSGNYSVRGAVSLGDAEDSEELRFSVPTDQAEAVLALVRQEPGVRRAWLGDSYRDT